MHADRLLISYINKEITEIKPKPKFSTPKTHILKNYGTQINCNGLLPGYFRVDGVQYKILIKLTNAMDPTTIHPTSGAS